MQDQRRKEKSIVTVTIKSLLILILAAILVVAVSEEIAYADKNSELIISSEEVYIEDVVANVAISYASKKSHPWKPPKIKE